MAIQVPTPVPDESRRFSVRLPRPLWIGLLAVALVVAGTGLRVGLPIYQQHAAIREIQRAGGVVLMRPADHDWLPDWLQKWMNDRERIEVFGVPEEVDRVGPGITDAGLAQIAAFTELRCLYLGRWADDPAGSGEHSGPMSLFAPLEPQYLLSDPARFSNEGLAQLTGLRKLQLLDLNGTRVTDAGLAHVAGLTELRALDLHGTDITDAGLRHLRLLINLERLDLRATDTTDAGLDELHGLVRLNAVALSYRQLSGDGLDRLRRARPRLRIVW